MGQAEPAEWIVQWDLDGQPRAAGLAEGEHVFGSPCETGAWIGTPHGGAGQRCAGRCLRAAFSFVGGGIVVRRGELQDEPGAGAAVGFHQEALSRGDPANEGLGQRFQAGFKGRNMTFVNACSCSVELVAVLADLQ